MHNVAQQVLEDLLMFTWPLGVVVARIFIDPRGGRFKRLELVGGTLGLIFLFFFLSTDGGLLLALAKAHLAWGATLLLTAKSALLSVTLSWRQTQSDDDQLSRGILDAQVTDVKLAGLRPRIFAGAAAGLAILALSWLYLISKTATGWLG
jgi:hypothetical protein